MKTRFGILTAATVMALATTAHSADTTAPSVAIQPVVSTQGGLGGLSVGASTLVSIVGILAIVAATSTPASGT